MLPANCSLRSSTRINQIPLHALILAFASLLFSGNCVFAQVPATSNETIPVDQVQPGMQGYAYTISEDPDLGHELLAWHWHPTTRLDTHIHIGKSHPTHGDLAKYHVPSGRVSFEQVVRFLITDLGVSPARADWDSVLTDSHGKFVTHRRWSNSSAIADPPEPN